MQTIVSFLRLQKDETQDTNAQMILQNLENKVFAISDLYALLHTKENISTVNAYEYFSSIIKNVQASFQKPNITICLNTKINLPSDDAVYCGFILNEAITNSFQHAFNNTDTGKISVILEEKKDSYHFTIQDNGKGFLQNKKSDTLGMIIIDSLTRDQLEGEINISSSEGTQINIIWKHHEQR